MSGASVRMIRGPRALMAQLALGLVLGSLTSVALAQPAAPTITSLTSGDSAIGLGRRAAVTMGGVLYLPWCGSEGCELWRTDGTASGTRIVKDIEAGSGSSSPSGLTVIGSTLFFAAYDSTNGRELWKSDGTAAGTVLVRDISIGAGSSSPSGLVALGSSLVFSAYGSSSAGIELWTSNGTSAGTTRVADIYAGTTSSAPEELTVVGGFVYFSAEHSLYGRELWRTDGTLAGTTLVSDITPGVGWSDPHHLTRFGSSLVFAAHTPANGNELFRSDSAGTQLVKDIFSGSGSSDPSGIVVTGSFLYFSARDATTGQELWRSDGTDGGTSKVKDIRPGAAGSFPQEIRAFGSLLFFAADDGTTGNELWKSDGTEAGTVLVKDLWTGAGPSSPAGIELKPYGVIFSARGTSGPGLYRSDGTPAGTDLVAETLAATFGEIDQITPLGTAVVVSAFSTSVPFNRLVLLTDPTVSISNVTLAEGNSGTTNATFTVTLSPSVSQTVTVGYATADGSAHSGSDYTATSGTLSIPAGSTTGTITVPVLGDTILENNEMFTVTLSNPTNATLLTATGTGTIQNDDTGKTACASGCDFTRIQDAINAAGAGGSVLVKSTYDSTTAGEVFPIQTLAINQSGAIRITGETDSAGSLTTTVRFRNGGPAVDAFNIVSPGSVLRDLRILPGDSTKVNRVITASRNPGTCPGTTCHLNGLTIQNVLIDFTVIGGTTTPHFNTGNGIDLLADNVSIDKVTIKGIAGNSISVDGDNYTILNSTLDGRDPGNGNAIRGALAIGFGGDKKLLGVACSGFPTNYLIDKNSLVGFKEGISWCTGRANTVSNNTITDISGKGIDTAGSQGTQIFGNILQQNTTAATHGIGLSTNAFQTCTGNTVRNNKVLGRAARDMQRGIVVLSCLQTTIFQNEVRDFADNEGAIYVTMTPGVATKTTIQGNTVIGGNAAGIVYMGADEGATAVDQSVIRDNVVNEFKRTGIVVQFIKGVRSGAGAGNVVAYNTVRAANQGSFGDTHAFNLQNLANTAFDRNTALDTKGGYGFFLANSIGVNGNCNTGSSNGAGLFGQANVTPPYGNVNVNCRAALYSHYDFDGDSKSEVTIYRHTTGQWFMKSSSTGADSVIAFGNPGSDDIPAPGNYTVTGRTDLAIYRYTTGEWYIRRATDGGTTVIPFGSPLVGDVPMPADYDGDGLTDLAVFRTSTANAEWYIRRSSDGATQYVAWGCAACADLGVPGDYDGDGKADVAVYRRSTGEWFIRKSSDTSLQQVPFGDVAQGDIPVPGRYTQATKTDMAVYRSLTGEFFVRRSTDFGTTAAAIGVPSAGDFPVSADFTAAGITDMAVYRPTPPTAAFLIRRSTDGVVVVIPYGNPGSQDAPLTAR
jgi:ELWxxDGT repeat protein/parallel beta-helix repeat protein